MARLRDGWSLSHGGPFTAAQSTDSGWQGSLTKYTFQDYWTHNKYPATLSL